MNRRENLWDITHGQRVRYLAAIACMALGHVFLFGVPLVSQRVIDAVASGDLGGRTPFEVLGAAGIAVVLLTITAGVFHFLRVRWAARASEGIARTLRQRLYTHLEHLPASYLDNAEAGDLVQRCTSDVETLRVFLNGQVVEIGRTILMVLTVLPILFWLDVRMTLVSIVLFPVITTFAAVYFRRVTRVFEDMDEAEGRMTAHLQENLTGVRVVRAFSAQPYEIERFSERNGEYRDKMYRLMRLLARYWAFSDLLCVTQQGLVLFAGAWWLGHGELTVGRLFAFITYESMVIWPIRHLGRVLSETGKAMVALKRVHHILTEPIEDNYDPEGTLRLPAFQGRIEIDDLSFAYKDAPVLQNVTLSIEPGQTLALLGPPGSGKSTLIQLLLRLYDYREGSIRFDGRELRDLPRTWVRSQIGAVLQEPFLYSRTVGSNIALGRGVTESDIETVARAANVHEDIVGFREGYDTMVGERGVTLSGGQRQRVSLARALLAAPTLLVLDDALSAVDTHTEARILDFLREQRSDSTTIIATHRLSSAVHADLIVVLEAGRIVQRGTHEQLVGSEGHYRRLWQIQGMLEDELSEDLEATGTASRRSR